ncbi:MAG: glycoside hydrolase family 30 protein [bacterium]
MIKTIITAKDTDYRLSAVDCLDAVANSQAAKITFDRKTKFQKIIGFGGAFTESACYNLFRVSPAVREKAIRMYFDPIEGIGYSIGRVSIHGCDFSLSSYTYIEEGDANLDSFNIARDRQYVIPIIRQAEQIRGKPIALLGSPWTPPAFMKDNNSPIHGGHLLEKYADSWARYFVRFVEEYRKAGLTVAWISVQNEPAAVQRWDSCIYSAMEERDFVKNHLGPTIAGSDVSDVKIMIWDHNRDIIVERVKPILGDPETARYVWGTAFHWYVSEAFENVGKVHELFPDKGLMFTEGCVENFHMHRYTWESGERYATNMIGDLANWCEGWMDWNLWLDNLGGPNHVNNVCDAPIIVDVFPEKLIAEASYYYIGHISKYVKPGAYRIKTENGNASLAIIGFENPGGEIVLVLLNKTAASQPYAFEFDGAVRSATAPARSMTTVLLAR